jgi:hypothetical protein
MADDVGDGVGLTGPGGTLNYNTFCIYVLKPSDDFPLVVVER